ncbi:MAG: hypothetical protein ACREGD_02750 [Candidatus Saccharimonadales bacterium]
MKVYDSFDVFWRDYFDGQDPSEAIDTWAIAKFTHTSDDEYRELQAAGRDNLGYQPTLLTLADPKRRIKEEVIIKNLPTATVHSLKSQYQKRFTQQLPRRFGLFNPSRKQADAVYPRWDDFAAEWFIKDGQDILGYNLPLLFDHVSDAEYWAWQQKGFDPCGTQRLVVDIFQHRTGRFAEIFITDVTDAEMSRIRLLMQSKLTLAAGGLL